MAQALPQTFFLQVLDLFCDATTQQCSASLPGTELLAVYDFNHISDRAAFVVSSRLCSFVYASGLMGTSC